MAKAKLEGKLTRKQRIEIAKDVIALCKSRQTKIKIDVGSYYHTESIRQEDNLFDKGGQLTSKRLPPCQLCARGALFIKSVDRYDKCDLGRIDDIADAVIDRSVKEWGAEQTNLIESHFEVSRYWLPQDPKRRLLAIMENIVANNGEYVPSGEGA